MQEALHAEINILSVLPIQVTTSGVVPRVPYSLIALIWLAGLESSWVTLSGCSGAAPWPEGPTRTVKIS